MANLTDIQSHTEERMKKTLEVLRTELKQIRTGRAHPGLLEQIRVSCYDTEMPLHQLATITIFDPRTLLVTPWDKGVIKAVEKAIMQSDLGLNPATVGQTIRVPLPLMTEERRKELVKLIRTAAEEARIGIRNIRRDANTQYKNLLKDKMISEDEEHRAEETIQKITNQYIDEIDTTLSKKEKDVMEV